MAEPLAPASFVVEKAGAQTTVQDSGRPGYLGRGIPPAGAQDNLALRVANLLVGNDAGPPFLTLGSPGAAGLECLLFGPSLRFTADTVFSLTGGMCAPKLDGAAVPMYAGVAAKTGQLLTIGMIKIGVRVYLAVAGGIDVPLYLGSRATHIAVGQGGFEGRTLQAGDALRLFPSDAAAGRTAPQELHADLSDEPILRVVMGPQDEMFDSKSRAAFLEQPWELLPMSNRMGLRFSGPTLTFEPDRPAYLDRDAGNNPSNIVDDIIPLGGIQTPDGNALIVMGVEHPTAGGYAKIATVISTDISRLGQLRPASVGRFQSVSAAEAIALETEIETRLAQWSAGLGAP
jgi:biotin-dependent carboxylase-like uncharacterized protein